MNKFLQNADLKLKAKKCKKYLSFRGNEKERQKNDKKNIRILEDFSLISGISN